MVEFPVSHGAFDFRHNKGTSLAPPAFAFHPLARQPTSDLLSEIVGNVCLNRSLIHPAVDGKISYCHLGLDLA